MRDRDKLSAFRTKIFTQNKNQWRRGEGGSRYYQYPLMGGLFTPNGNAASPPLRSSLPFAPTTHPLLQSSPLTCLHFNQSLLLYYPLAILVRFAQKLQYQFCTFSPSNHSSVLATKFPHPKISKILTMLYLILLTVFYLSTNGMIFFGS